MIEPRLLPSGHTLRLIQTTDADALADAYARNRSYLSPWEPTRPDEYFTPAWHSIDILRQVAEHAAHDLLPLVLATGDRLVGRVTVSGITRGAFQSGRVGYWIDEAETGKGIMSAAVRQLRGIARDDFGLHRLEAGTLVHNRASQRVLEKAGFERIGIAPQYLCIDARWQDHVLFQTILRDDEACT